MGSLIIWKGNQARRGATDVPFLSTGTNTAVLRLDEVILDGCVGSAGGTVGDPNGLADVFSSTMTNLTACLVNAGHPTLFGLVDNRRNNADCHALRLLLYGVGGAKIINLAPAPLTLDRVQNITLGGLSFYESGGQTIASAAPSGAQAQGRWVQGKRIYDSAPLASPATNVGWVNITPTLTLPQTWRAFG